MLQTRNFRMDSHEYAYCFISITADVQEHSTFFRKIELYSYNTLVLTIELPDNNGMNSLTCTGLYSRSTTRQLVWFLNQFHLRVSISVIKEWLKHYDDIPIILDKEEYESCICKAETYWNTGRTMNLDSYAKRVKEAIEKSWY